MQSFRDRTAVITGAGTGMGRELARQLAAEGCHLALCDVSEEAMEETRRLCDGNVRVTTQICDVSDEAQMISFRDAVCEDHRTDHVHLLFNNAGIGGGGSMIADDRADWDRTFAVCWNGVYFGTRAFLPLLVASDEACLVNTSSVNGFWASLGPGMPHTAYSAAKFAVKGFTEALISDLRVNAPHVRAFLVMPGHVGTSIVANSGRVLGKPAPKEMTAEDLEPLRARLAGQGLPVEGLSDDQLRAAIQQRMDDFRDKAPLTAAQAATLILDGIRAGRWRILVGEDALQLDRMVRETPEEAYDDVFYERILRSGHFGGLG